MLWDKIFGLKLLDYLHYNAIAIMLIEQHYAMAAFLPLL